MRYRCREWFNGEWSIWDSVELFWYKQDDNLLLGTEDDMFALAWQLNGLSELKGNTVIEINKGGNTST